ncbi:MAG: HAD-IC family P-type ATPase [Halioglobus sp.]|nr:HAD-IC family P-type ATPase [Halioglobus sp.]
MAAPSLNPAESSLGDAAQGLSTSEAQRLLSEYGPNKLPDAPTPGVLSIFFRQFLSPFIYILLIAAAASLALDQLANAVFILGVLLLNAVIGTVQEFSAQQSAAALRNMVRGEARVIRDGSPQKVDIEHLVPGDLVLLSSGDKVPADLRLEVSINLAVDESMLTGESLAVTKNARARVAEHAPPVGPVRPVFRRDHRHPGAGAGPGLRDRDWTPQIGRIAGHVTAGDTVAAADDSHPAFHLPGGRRNPDCNPDAGGLDARARRLWRGGHGRDGDRSRGFDDPRRAAGGTDRGAGHRHAADGGSPTSLSANWSLSRRWVPVPSFARTRPAP